MSMPSAGERLTRLLDPRSRAMLAFRRAGAGTHPKARCAVLLLHLRTFKMDLLVWLEQTALASWVRESSSLWAYPTILFMHTLGMSMVAGLSSAIDLRIVGVGREIPIS